MLSASQVSLCCLSLCVFLCGTIAQSVRPEDDEQLKEAIRKQGIDPDNPQPGTIMLTPPKLSAEDEGSQFMPKAYRCAGCTAIAYQLNKAFEAAEKKTKKGAYLSEAEILDATDSVCESEFKNYGLKNVQGTNYLSGEGLEANEMSGMVEAGGKWAKRLQNICLEIMGNYEEEQVYGFYRVKEVGLKTFICESYCHFNGAIPIKDEF